SLPRGFERVVYADGRFLLVRAEAENPGAPLRSVAYDLVPGKPLGEPRGVRPSERDDVSGFFYHGLTPDGTYYWWTGAREPRRGQRVEVRELATGKLVVAVPRTEAMKGGELWAYLSPDGGRLWVGWGTRDGVLAYELPGVKAPRAGGDAPQAASAD